MSENEFPPNSHSKKGARVERSAEKASPREEVQQITRNKVTIRKKPLYKKFIEAFRPEDNVGFVEYTLLEVLVPGIKDAFADAVHGTIDNALGTSGSRRRRGRRGEGGYTSYNRMGAARPRGRRDRDRDDDERRPRRESRGPSDHREIIVDSRVEAEEVVDALIELASKYDVATMRDLLSLVGEHWEYTDEDWGWSDLRGTRIHRVNGGRYLIDLPRPEPLD